MPDVPLPIEHGVTPQRIGRTGMALTAVVLTLGLGSGAAASAAVARAERDIGSAELTRRTETVRTALDRTLQRYADTIHDLAAVAAVTAPARLGPVVAGIAGTRLPGAHRVLVLDAGHTVLAQHAADGSAPPPAG